MPKLQVNLNRQRHAKTDRHIIEHNKENLIFKKNICIDTIGNMDIRYL